AAARAVDQDLLEHLADRTPLADAPVAHAATGAFCVLAPPSYGKNWRLRPSRSTEMFATSAVRPVPTSPARHSGAMKNGHPAPAPHWKNMIADSPAPDTSTMASSAAPCHQRRA